MRAGVRKYTMTSERDITPPSRRDPTGHQRGADKMARVRVKFEPTAQPLRKPPWIRTRVRSSTRVQELKQVLREKRLFTVCEEANCPNLAECFGHGTATFLIMGDICTRRCPFCDVAHGRPEPLNPDEPTDLAATVKAMGLSYVVITSVDRDDLRDGGAGHFSACVQAVRDANPGIKIEVLVPDFRGRMDIALQILDAAPPDVFNHNLETVPRLYKLARPGADYAWSLDLIRQFKGRQPAVPGKSGLMLGLGEKIDEVKQVMHDLREHDCDMLTVGQYLQPSRDHLPVVRYVHPDEFEELREAGEAMGFTHVASGPLVRSSYHADQQASGVLPADAVTP